MQVFEYLSQPSVVSPTISLAYPDKSHPIPIFATFDSFVRINTNIGVQSTVRNVTKVSCFVNKNVCLVAGNGFVESIIVTRNQNQGKQRKLEEKKPTDKEKKDKKPVTKSQSTVPGSNYEVKLDKTFYRKRIRLTKIMKISLSVLTVIPNTHYFLEGSTVGDGLARWNLDKNRKYAKTVLKNVPKFIPYTDLKIITGTKYAVGTLSGWRKLFVLDFITMNFISQFSNAYGFVDYLSKNPKNAQLVLAQENQLKVYSYIDGQYDSTVITDYYISTVKSIQRSDFVIVAHGHFLRVYNIKKTKIMSIRPYIFSFKAKDSILDVDFSHKSGQFYISGNGFVTSILVTQPRTDHCFDLCEGCKFGFSSYGCSKCKSIAQKTNPEATLPKFGTVETNIGVTLEQTHSRLYQNDATVDALTKNDTQSNSKDIATVYCVQKWIPSVPQGEIKYEKSYSIATEIAFIPGFTRRLWFYLLSIFVLCVTVFVCGWYAFKLAFRKTKMVKYTHKETKTNLIGKKNKMNEIEGPEVVQTTDRVRLNTETN